MTLRWMGGDARVHCSISTLYRLLNKFVCKRLVCHGLSSERMPEPCRSVYEVNSLGKRLVTPEALDPLFHNHDPCNLVAQAQRRNNGNQQDVSHLNNWRFPLESFALFGCERMERGRRGGSRADRSQNSVTPYSAEEVDLQRNARGVVRVEPWHTGSQGPRDKGFSNCQPGTARSITKNDDV